MYALSLSPGGDLLAAGCSDGVVRLVDLNRPSASVSELRGLHDGAVRAVAFRPGRDRQLATAGADGNVWLITIDNDESRLIHRHTEWPFAVAFSPRGDCLSSGGSGGRVLTTDLESSKVFEVPCGDREIVRCIEYVSDHAFIVGGGEGDARIYDARQSSVRASLRGSDDWLMSVAMAMAGTRALTGDGKGRLRVWSISPAAASLEDHAKLLDGTIRCVTVTDASAFLAGSGSDVIRFDPLTLSILQTVDARPLDAVFAMVWDSRRSQILFAGLGCRLMALPTAGGDAQTLLDLDFDGSEIPLGDCSGATFSGATGISPDSQAQLRKAGADV